MNYLNRLKLAERHAEYAQANSEDDSTRYTGPRIELTVVDGKLVARPLPKETDE